MSYKYILLSIFALSFTLNLEARRIKGMIIFSENDTVYASIEIPHEFLNKERVDFVKLQNEIHYYNEDGEKVALKPHEIKEYHFFLYSKRVRMISKPKSHTISTGSDRSTHVFLRRAIKGDISAFRFYSVGNYNAARTMKKNKYGVMVDVTSNNSYNYVLQKGDGEITEHYSLGFKKTMSAYVSDCPELAEKVNKKIYRYSNTLAIVKYYNSEKCNP